jgi:hypothetical protein
MELLKGRPAGATQPGKLPVEQVVSIAARVMR